MQLWEPNGGWATRNLLETSPCLRLFPAHMETLTVSPLLSSETEDTSTVETHTASIATHSRVSKRVLNGRFNKPNRGGVMRKQIREHVSKRTTWLKQMRAVSLTHIHTHFTGWYSSCQTENTSQINEPKLIRLCWKNNSQLVTEDRNVHMVHSTL